MLCPSQLTAQPGALEIWKIALQDGFCVQLFRDEVFMVHKEFLLIFDGMKGKEISKRKRDIEDCLNHAMTHRFVLLLDLFIFHSNSLSRNVLRATD